MPPRITKSSREDFKAQYYPEGRSEVEGQVVELVVACGPFTLDSDLNYAPLLALIDAIEVDTPEILILGGPFVSADHPRVKDGSLPVTFQTLFDEHVLMPLQDLLLSKPKLQIVLVPSLTDVNHEAIFPQPPLSINVRDDLYGERVHGGL